MYWSQADSKSLFCYSTAQNLLVIYPVVVKHERMGTSKALHPKVPPSEFHMHNVLLSNEQYMHNLPLSDISGNVYLNLITWKWIN